MMLGSALILNGEIESGLTHLDEAMVAVVDGELSARATGLIYCVVIGICEELYDLRRAREWSDALAEWCAGTARVHRRLPGAVPGASGGDSSAGWGMAGGGQGGPAGLPAAHRRIRRDGRRRPPSTNSLNCIVCAVSSPMRNRRTARRCATAGTSSPDCRYYGWRRAGKLRLRQRSAVPWPRRPKIGTGLACCPRPSRSCWLPGMSGGRARCCGAGPDRGRVHIPALQAGAAYAQGVLHLAEGSAEQAATPLRRAFRLWRELDVPYEAARVRVQIALACRALGDEDSAAMELDAARQVFVELGAVPDIARVDELGRGSVQAGGLSPRELDVVRLVAAGRTNQAIAAELYLSEKTVARHVSNIFVKLGVSSRTAAAAYAFEHGLV